MCCRMTASLEKEVPVCLLHLSTVEVYVFTSAAMQSLHVHCGQGLHSSQTQALEVTKSLTDVASKNQLLEVLTCYLTSK